MDAAKAQAFWARKQALRRLPGHCSGCGCVWPGPFATCPKCRARCARRRGSDKHEAILVPSRQLDQIERRVRTLERHLRNVQEYARAEYKRGYCVGRRRGVAVATEIREPDAWGQTIGVEAARQCSHRLEPRA